MKIGISTYFKAHNYGAMLQAYATKTILEKNGHEAYMIDNDFETHAIPKPKSFKSCSLKEKLLYPKYFIKWFYPTYKAQKKRNDAFVRFQKQLTIAPDNSQLDIVVYGSDQIWSKLGNQYYDAFWGNDKIVAPKIAYAASGIMQIESEEDKQYIRHALEQFTAISVREPILKEQLENLKLYNRPIEVTIDPTLLLTKTEWEEITPRRIIEEPYLFFYDFNTDPKTSDIVQYISKQRNLRIIRVTDGIISVKNDPNYFMTAGPYDFLSLIKHADFVFSSSFHGTAFSLIFEKQFYVHQNYNTERVKALLAQAGIPNRFVSNKFDINLDNEIDYKLVNETLRKIVNVSKRFLLKAIHDR